MCVRGEMLHGSPRLGISEGYLCAINTAAAGEMDLVLARGRRGGDSGVAASCGRLKDG